MTSPLHVLTTNPGTHQASCTNAGRSLSQGEHSPAFWPRMLVASASRHVPFTTIHYPHLISIAPFGPATSPVQKGQAPGRGWGDLLNPKRHLGSHQPICFLLDRLDQHLKSMADLAAQHPTLHFWPMRPKSTFNLRYGLARTRNEKITLLSFQKWRQHEMRCNLDEPATIHPWLHE